MEGESPTLITSVRIVGPTWLSRLIVELFRSPCMEAHWVGVWASGSMDFGSAGCVGVAGCANHLRGLRHFPDIS